MAHREILNIAAVANDDAIDIPAQHRVAPNGAVAPESDIAEGAQIRLILNQIGVDSQSPNISPGARATAVAGLRACKAVNHWATKAIANHV